MNLTSVVQNPVFTVVVGALGGLCAPLLKGRLDIWTSEAKRRQDMVNHFIHQIEAFAPSYYLMSNHAYLLSSRLDNYLRSKQEWQMTMLDPDEAAYKNALDDAENTAAEALFEAGKLYRVITDRIWNEGGEYLVADRWAIEALESLHNKLVALLRFDSNVLMTYIDSKTQRHEFLAKLKQSRTDDSLKDLRDQYAGYKDWVLKQDKELKLLAANARAYSELFSLQMKRLYKDVWGKSSEDPLQAQEVTGASTALSASTRTLIQRAANENDRRREKRDAQGVGDTVTDAADAYFSVGWSYHQERQWDRAVESYQKAIAKNPSKAAAYNNLGNAYTNLGAFESAAEAYGHASKLEPGNPIFPHNRGKMLSRRTKPEEMLSQFKSEAISCFETAIELGRASEPANDWLQALRYNDLGIALTDQKKWDDAVAAYSEAIALNPLEPVFHANLALTYEGKRDGSNEQDGAAALDAATGAYRMAANLASGDGRAIYERSMAGMFQKARNWAKALDAYRQALEHCVSEKEKAETTYQTGRLYEEQKNWNQAAGFYQQALELGGDRSKYAASLINALHESGNRIPCEIREKAIAACRKAINDQPDQLIHRSRLANVYYYLNDYVRCVDERDELVRLAEGRVTAKEMAGYYNQLALAYRRQEMWDLALRYYSKAIQIDPAWEYLKNMGLFLQARGLYDAAEGVLERALATPRTSDEYDILLSMAQVEAYGSKHDIESAIQRSRAAALKLPGDPKASILLGDLLVQKGSFEEGADNYDKAADLTLNTKERLDLLRKGIQAYDQALAAAPNRVEVQYRRARMLFRSDDNDGAEAGYRKALELAGDHRLNLISIQNSLAQVLYRRADYKGAITVWNNALEVAERLSGDEQAVLSKAPLGPIDIGQMRNNLGTAYDGLGQKEDALRCYGEVAQSSPGSFVPHFNLGTGMYRQQQFLKALSEFQEAFRLRPPVGFHARILFRTGLCFFRLGCLDLAFEKWADAARPEMDLAEAHYNMGVLLWLNGQLDDAAKRWEKVSESLPEALFALGVLSLKRGDSTQAIGYWKKITGANSFENLPQTIQIVEKGEKPELTVNIKDI